MLCVFRYSKLNGYRFPNRKKSPERFASWSDSCKRKSFQSRQNARELAEHVIWKQNLTNLKKMYAEFLRTLSKERLSSVIQTNYIAETENPFIFYENVGENNKCGIGI